MTLETIGWISQTLLAICAAFEFFPVLKNKRSNINLGLLLTWYLGEVLAVIYIIPQEKYPLLFNYSLNTIMLSVILYYRLFPKKGEEKK